MSVLPTLELIRLKLRGGFLTRQALETNLKLIHSIMVDILSDTKIKEAKITRQMISILMLPNLYARTQKTNISHFKGD